MKKIYILDTSVLIDDPSAYTHFNNSIVLIPIAVVNELDKKKTSPGEVGRNARVCCKLLDKACALGDVSLGVTIDNDILLKVDASYYDLKEDCFKGFGDPHYGDTQILATTYNAYKNNPYNEVVLVSNDINLRIKARARGINAVSHDVTKCSLSDLYTGSRTIVNEKLGMDLQKNGVIDPNKYELILNPNECVLVEDDSGDGLALARKVGDKLKLIKKAYPWGLSSRNKEQTFAIELINDSSVDLVTMIGKAGTGKSLVAVAAAIDLVINKKAYEKLIIYRPIQAVGNDIGFLPGEMEEKLAPWFQAIMDSFEYLFSMKNGGSWKKELEMYQKKERIQMEAITYIRGRSIPNAIILVDEAQNISREDIKTMLTRAGENTKIILTGDIEQIDNSGLDATNNGLTYVIEKFKTSDLAGHVTLTEGERSKLATLASEIL